jgi:hypothetical protein
MSSLKFVTLLQILFFFFFYGATARSRALASFKWRLQTCLSWDSPDIVTGMKSKRIRWAGHVAREREIGNAYILGRKPVGKWSLRKPRQKWGIVLKWTLENQNERSGFNWVRLGSCERGKESWESINNENCVDQLSEYQLLKKHTAPWSSPSINYVHSARIINSYLTIS